MLEDHRGKFLLIVEPLFSKLMLSTPERGLAVDPDLKGSGFPH